MNKRGNVLFIWMFIVAAIIIVGIIFLIGMKPLQEIYDFTVASVTGDWLDTTNKIMTVLQFVPVFFIVGLILAGVFLSGKRSDQGFL